MHKRHSNSHLLFGQLLNWWNLQSIDLIVIFIFPSKKQSIVLMHALTIRLAPTKANRQREPKIYISFKFLQLKVIYFKWDNKSNGPNVMVFAYAIHSQITVIWLTNGNVRFNLFPVTRSYFLSLYPSTNPHAESITFNCAVLISFHCNDDDDRKQARASRSTFSLTKANTINHFSYFVSHCSLTHEISFSHSLSQPHRIAQFHRHFCHFMNYCSWMSAVDRT